MTPFACSIPEHIMACIFQSSLQLRLAMWLGSRQCLARSKVFCDSQRSGWVWEVAGLSVKYGSKGYAAEPKSKTEQSKSRGDMKISQWCGDL